jgi:hypothetical protein
MTEIQNSKRTQHIFEFGHLNLGIVSDFDIRISDFSICSIAFWSRWITFAFPKTSNTSSIGGLTVLPVRATRMG